MPEKFEKVGGGLIDDVCEKNGDCEDNCCIMMRHSSDFSKLSLEDKYTVNNAYGDQKFCMSDPDCYDEEALEARKQLIVE